MHDTEIMARHNDNSIFDVLSNSPSVTTTYPRVTNSILFVTWLIRGRSLAQVDDGMFDVSLCCISTSHELNLVCDMTHPFMMLQVPSAARRWHLRRVVQHAFRRCQRARQNCCCTSAYTHTNLFMSLHTWVTSFNTWVMSAGGLRLLLYICIHTYKWVMSLHTWVTSFNKWVMSACALRLLLYICIHTYKWVMSLHTWVTSFNK